MKILVCNLEDTHENILGFVRGTGLIIVLVYICALWKKLVHLLLNFELPKADAVHDKKTVALPHRSRRVVHQQYVS